MKATKDRRRKREMKINPASKESHRPLARRRCVRALARVSLGIVVSGLMAGFTSIPAVNAGAATSITSNKPYAQAQLLKLPNLPRGWTRSGSVWAGTSASDDSSSMLTMTQFPGLSTCLGSPPALSVVAAEASSPEFDSKDGNTSILDVADVYTSPDQAKSDFPPLNDPKFASCFLQVQGPSIENIEKNEWPSGATFGTPMASVSHQPKFGDQSGLVEVEVPVNLPGEQGGTDDFFVTLIIRQGRSTAELIMDQGDTPPSAALTDSLAQTVTAKMKAPPPGNVTIAA